MDELGGMDNFKYRQIEILAGKSYRWPLAMYLQQAGYYITVPMEGLGIGQQLQWLNKQLDLMEQISVPILAIEE